MRIRTKAHRFFRRVGHTFTREWQDVDTTQLTPEQLAFLTGDQSRRVLEIDDGGGKKPEPAAKPEQPPPPPKREAK